MEITFPVSEKKITFAPKIEHNGIGYIECCKSG